MITVCCILILNLISVNWKLGKGLLHVHKITRWKTNATLRNNVNSVSNITCTCFFQGFAWVGHSLDYIYMNLIDQFFPLPTPCPSIHLNVWQVIQMVGIGTLQWTSLSPIKGGPELTPLITSKTVNIHQYPEIVQFVVAWPPKTLHLFLYFPILFQSKWMPLRTPILKKKFASHETGTLEIKPSSSMWVSIHLHNWRFIFIKGFMSCNYFKLTFFFTW